MLFGKALHLNPRDVNYQNNLVQALVMSGQHEKAEALIGKLLGKRDDPSELLYLQALSLMRSGKGEAALKAAAKAVDANPSHAKAHNLRGMVFSDMGRDIEAVAAYQASLAAAPDAPDTLSNLSLPLSRLSRTNEGLAALRRALQIDPAHSNALQRYAIQLNEAGCEDEAKEAFRALLDVMPTHGEAMLQLTNMQTAEENAALLPLLKKAITTVPANSPDTVALNFALSEVHWQAGEIQQAARALKTANRQFAKRNPFDVEREVNELANILALFPAAETPVMAKGTLATRPIFVLGQPRSGTTLTEQILSAHPKVTGFGELATAGRLVSEIIQGDKGFDPEDFAKNYLKSLPETPEDAEAFIDKMPANYRYVGFLACAFPQARFVWILRDVALSLWRGYYPAGAMRFAFDLTAMAQVANMHQRYLAHWQHLFPERILTIRYEDIVADINTASHQLAAFCGLEWVEEMSCPERNTAAVRTASVGQVGQGVHTRSVGGWKRLADALLPFTEELDKDLWPEVAVS